MPETKPRSPSCEKADSSLSPFAKELSRRALTALSKWLPETAEQREVAGQTDCKAGDTQEDALTRTRNFLCGYQLCLDMLNLRRYERKRKTVFDDPFDPSDILAGGEPYWRARMYEVESLIGAMKNSREKLILYYHYVRGESIERAADLLNVSRRTGYRLHQRGLRSASLLFERMKKTPSFSDPNAYLCR